MLGALGASSSLVGARGLHVARLLALVADALAASLGGAVAAQVTNLTACVKRLHFWPWVQSRDMWPKPPQV